MYSFTRSFEEFINCFDSLLTAVFNTCHKVSVSDMIHDEQMLARKGGGGNSMETWLRHNPRSAMGGLVAQTAQTPRYNDIVPHHKFIT